MYEIIKTINDTTSLAVCGNTVYIAKKIDINDVELYKRLVSINHKNIVKHHEVVIIGDDFYIIEDYIQGMTLEEYCKANHPLDEKEIIRLTISICNGLSAIHKEGIIHRDITPTNIMIDSNAEPIIIDFGICRKMKPDQSTDTQILGTRGFAAPEQYGFNQTNQRADIYSLGVLINYMATLMLPNEKMPNGKLNQIICKCILLDEAQRYNSVDEVILALEGNSIESVVRSIPGFRKGIGWHIVVACSYYFSVFIILLTLLFEGKGVWVAILNEIIAALFLIVPVPIFTNINNWINKWSFTRKLDRGGKIAIQITLTAICDILGGILILLLPQ